MRSLKRFLSIICMITILTSQSVVLAISQEESEMNANKQIEKNKSAQSENTVEEITNRKNTENSQNTKKEEEEEIKEKQDETTKEKTKKENEISEKSLPNQIMADTENKEKEDNEKANVHQNEALEEREEENQAGIMPASASRSALKPLENGVYKLRSAINLNYVLDVSGASQISGGNVQIWTSANAYQQRFRIQKQSDGYYTITAMHSSKVFDVANAAKTNGANLWQYQGNGTDAQKWKITATSDGYYTFQSKCNQLYIDISGGVAANGVNAQLYMENGTKAQKFKLERVDNIEREKTIETGTYTIRLANHKDQVLDIDGGKKENGANLQVWKIANVRQQRYEVKYLSDGYYEIMSYHSGKVLDVSGGNIENKTNVWQYGKNQTDAQKWIIRKTSDGYYTIISKLSGSYLQVASSSAANGTNVRICDVSNEAYAQKFIFEKYEIKGEKTLENGVYRIRSVLNSKFVFDISAANTANKANVQIWTSTNELQQKFRFTYHQGGYYTITSELSGKKALEVAGQGRDNGTNVWQNASNSSDGQKWILQKDAKGYYSMMSMCNELYIDVNGGIATNGRNVQMYEGNGSNAQKFILEKVEVPKSEKTVENGIYFIQSALNNQQVFDIDGGKISNKASLQVWQNTNVKQQMFEFTYQSNGYYQIKAKHSGKVLQVANDALKNQTEVWQNAASQSDGQKWIISKTSDGYYTIASKLSASYLEVASTSAKNGTKVQMNEYNKNSKQQKFKIVKVQNTIVGTKTIEDGDYEINTVLKNDMVVDVSGASTSQGANVQIWNYTNVNQQMFHFTYKGNGFYVIQAKHSGKVLEVANSKANGANVYQATLTGSDRQLWIVESLGDKKYRIQSKFNGLYLDVSTGSKQNGTNLQVWQYANTDAQIFRLRTIRKMKGIDVSAHQGIINWNSVKNQGVQFAIIRIGYGKNDIAQDDAQFARNVSECDRLGIPYGVYTYSYALTKADVQSEVDHVLRLIAGKNPTLGVWIDMEDADGYKARNGGVIAENCIQICEEFCKKIDAKGYQSGIYANKSWFDTYLNDARLDNNRKWVAQWNSTCTIEKAYDVWQYTNSGTLDGVFGRVDMDYYYVRNLY